ncbi:hypothetical protein LCGC14_1118790 [marine sediment metagenome]|uniref:Uncharacterized protein n=1 Tax=marine sediment metagenome TaxID=412755 RepID=A0A0F9M9F0_9ZZZZ
MPEEQEYIDDDDDQQESFAYADYTGVVMMIQTYYYRMIESFRKYYILRLKGRDLLPLKQEIQSYISTTVQLMRNYDPIKKNKKLIKLFEEITEFVGTLENISFDKLQECINKVVDAHYILGLSKLEFKKYKKEDHLDKYKKDL